jgi:predicted phosphoadenosine phosphosulfate sulfurtransferase
MSSGYWQTKRQSEQYSTGNTVTKRAMDYIQTWEVRCYVEGIPDELQDGVMKSCRAPSYKAIALAILRNDHNLYALGFSERKSAVVDAIIQINRPKTLDVNYELFTS